MITSAESLGSTSSQEEAGVERGGLGGDPSVASGGADVDLADREGARGLEEQVRSALASDIAPKYERAPAGSAVNAVEPRVRELLQAFPTMPSTVIGERIGWTHSIRTLSGRVAELRPAYVPPDPASRTSYVAEKSGSAICGSRRPHAADVAHRGRPVTSSGSWRYPPTATRSPPCACTRCRPTAASCTAT